MKKINIRVQPRSSVEKVVRASASEYKIYTHKPAVDGKANEAVLRIMSEYLKVKRSRLCITKGLKSRNKVVEVIGCRCS